MKAKLLQYGLIHVSFVDIFDYCLDCCLCVHLLVLQQSSTGKHQLTNNRLES